MINLIIIGIAVMCLMALAVVLFVIMYQRRVILHQLEIKTLDEKKQMELLRASLQSEEEERRRIAAELHDDVGATLSSVRLFLHQAEKNSSDAAIIHQSGELVDESIRKIRDISHKLQPALLETLGLYASLQALADLYTHSGSITIRVQPEQHLPRLVDYHELHIYRIIQELINNCVRHSKSTGISIRISSVGRTLLISLDHDGMGITNDEYESLRKEKNGIGLKNISNRLQFIQGEISFNKKEDATYRIQMNIPINS